jgi:hypothetical protein
MTRWQAEEEIKKKMKEIQRCRRTDPDDVTGRQWGRELDNDGKSLDPRDDDDRELRHSPSRSRKLQTE